jgi:hypothetical protein
MGSLLKISTPWEQIQLQTMDLTTSNNIFSNNKFDTLNKE